MPLSVATQGSAYLLTHRSWTSRMGTGFQEMELLAAPAPGDDQVRVLEYAQVLHHAVAGHRQARRKGAERLTVLLVELIQEGAPAGVRECLEHLVHAEDNR